MAGRPLMVATLLGASIGVPYAVSHTQQQMKPGGTTAPSAAVSPQSNQGGFATSPTYATPYGSSPHGSQPVAPPLGGSATMPTVGGAIPVEGPRFHTIPGVFRFDVSREWIYQNWGRKSTGLGDPSMYGIRVPLVTGTGLSDLAGALTYQFNAAGQVEHISFRGRTADTTAILQYLTKTYQFQRMEAPAGEQLYQVRSGNDVYSEFRSRPEGVLNANMPHGSFGVVIELGRPGSNRPLVPQTPKLDVPPAPAPPPVAEKAAEDGAGVDGEVEPALVGKIRPATPAEEGQVMSRRWPN